MERKRIAVLFGGASSEYEVSLQSAYAVMTHIDTRKYEILPIGIAKNEHGICTAGNCRIFRETTGLLKINVSRWQFRRIRVYMVFCC